MDLFMTKNFLIILRQTRLLPLRLLIRKKYADVIKKAQAFLLDSQFDEGEGYSEDHEFYGGIGYGSRIRPDLSNLQTALEALKDSGLPSDDETWQAGSFVYSEMSK